MTFDDVDRLLHEIRARHAAEDEVLTAEQLVARDNAALDAFCADLGLPAAPTTMPSPAGG